MGATIGSGGTLALPGGIAIAVDAVVVAQGVQTAVAGGILYSVGSKSSSDHQGKLNSSGTLINAGDKTPRGRVYSNHGAIRANQRGFDSQKIDSIIDNNYNSRVKEIDRLTGKVTWRYQDKRGNTVITDEFGIKIVTVYSHPASVNGGNYIPKSQ